MTLTEIVYLDTKMQIFFMLTESCRAQGSEAPFDQSRLGTMSFQNIYSIIAPGTVRTHSAPGYRITKHIHPQYFTYVNLGNYVENLDALKVDAITEGKPAPEVDARHRVRVYIYCPPCACQVATAFDICEYSDKKDFVEFCIRIDHRQRTSCSASVSRIEGLVSVIDHLKEKEKNYQGSHLDFEMDRLKAIDREWLERQIYHYTEEDRLATLSPANQLARIAELHKAEGQCAAIILLGEADYCIPLMGALPFRPFEPGGLPRETYLFRSWQKYDPLLKGWCWERDYMGTYSSKAPLPPRRPVPADSDTTQMLESAQRISKRPRSSTSEEGSSPLVI